MAELKGREKQIVGERIKKLDKLRESGVDPYPQDFEKKNWCGDLVSKYSKLKEEEVSNDLAVCAGRLVLKRAMGKIAFGTLQDDTGKIQVLVQDNLDAMKSFKGLDTGDFFGVVGKPMKTKKGELSVLASEIVLLSKSVKPLPDKFHGIVDKEERYRKRYLDLIMNEEVREVFVLRSKVVSYLRRFLEGKGFMEVETPLIQSVYGGASSKPFTTHINALDMDAYLSISPELYLKRLIVGGYEKVFTICKNFRNEGVDYSHNPEFTMMEYYIAYKDFEYHIKWAEEFFEGLFMELGLDEEIEYRGNKINFKRPFKRITFRDLLMEHLNIDIDVEDDFEKFKAAMVREKVEVDIAGCLHYGSLLDEVYKRVIRPSIIQPTFLTHYPAEMIALAKRNKEDPRKINSVQLLIDGAEVFKAYDELNDPMDQVKRFEEQAALMDKGDDEAMMKDEDFIDALMIGMPPTAGFGMGIDRLVMILAGKDSIRDVIFFPFMRPIEKE